MFSIEAESIINKTWIIINRSLEDKTPIIPRLEEQGILIKMIEEAISLYPKVKNRKPDVYARALLLRSNMFEVILELKKEGPLFMF
jgi:hypothetical protein